MTMLTPEERAANGRKAREVVPRSRHGEWRPAATGPTRSRSTGLAGRVAPARGTCPIRYGRMAASPFAFYPGAPPP